MDAAIGFLSGILGGAASLSGALPAMWLSIRPWTKAETRAVLQPFNVAILTTTVTLVLIRGAYTPAAIQALLITIPVGMAAALGGIFVFRRLSDTSFRWLLIGLTFLMGIGIFVSEFS